MGKNLLKTRSAKRYEDQKIDKWAKRLRIRVDAAEEYQKLM